MKVISVDPGYERLGVAILEKSPQTNKDIVLYSTCLRTNKETPFSIRLLELGNAFSEIMFLYRPTHIALETLYLATNKTTAMGVSEVRGMLLFLAAQHGLSVVEFAPSQVKLAVAGYGKATKQDVEKMIRLLVKLPEKQLLDDELDAIAVGITALTHQKIKILS